MITVYHTATSEVSRTVLAFLEYMGERVQHIPLLPTPPEREDLRRLINQAGLTPRQILRQKGTPYQTLGLNRPNKSDDVLIDTMLSHPVLINQPLVETETIVRLCRPADLILDVVRNIPDGDFVREDGTPFIRDSRILPTLEALRPAFRSVGLPPPECYPSPAQFYAFHTLGGALVGYAVLDLRSPDALIPALVTAPMYRNTSLMRSLAALLFSRAILAGAERAWLTTRGVRDADIREGFAPPHTETLADALRSRLPPAYGMAAGAELLCRTLYF